ncbi:MAG: tetratricopeptide repeat protein, partial [Kofleriaceae bacterium]
VFALDPENVEAHERLKDIFVSQGREQEAEVELLKLAELVAPGDPDRAESYLQELLAMNGTHTGAFELARRFRLRVARMSSVSSELEYGPGGVAAVDVEMDDLDLAEPVIAARAVGIARQKRDSVDDFDPHALIGNRVAHGSPTPQRPPAAPAGRHYEPDNYELDFDHSPSQSTRQMSPEQVERLASNLGEDSDIIVDRPPSWADVDNGHNPTHFDDPAFHAVDAQLDDNILDDNIDQEIAAELGGSSGLDMPFDPDEARAFDAAVPKAEVPTTDAVYVSGFEETDMPNVTDTRPPYEGSDESLEVAGGYDPYGTEAVQAPPYDTAAHLVGNTTNVGIEDAIADAPRAETSIEDELDEADFYSGQGMYAEALDVLRNLMERYPHHRLIGVKYHEVEALVNGHDVAPDSIEHEIPSNGTDAIDLDEIEELDEFEEIASEVGEAPIKKRKPTVMLERPVDEGEFETHYDLGLAYKEMGLFDEAIKAFEKTLRSPEREVQCRVMIGMCQREMGNPSDAIHQFKQGLHCEPSEHERQSLYYEIGMTYEGLGDEAEALYYFEMVMKRDPSFADAGMRADRLRGRVGRAVRPQDDDI